MMQIDGKTIPSPMGDRGQYLPTDAPILAKNGKKEAITGGYPRITWTWPSLLLEEYDWWVTTLLGGARSKICTSTNQLYDVDGNLTTYSSVTVYKPTHQGFESGYVLNVQVEIEDMIE